MLLCVCVCVPLLLMRLPLQATDQEGNVVLTPKKRLSEHRDLENLTPVKKLCKDDKQTPMKGRKGPDPSELKNRDGFGQKGSCVIWLDWKQNISLPIQHTETGDSFWAQARAECSVLGMIVYTAAEKGKEPRKRCFVYVSDIIDHTCLAASIQLDLARTDELANFKGISNIAVWADCGPHYRCIDFLGHLAQSWVMPRRSNRINLSVNYHAEKHGKGDVDALFAVVNSWVERAKREPNCNIKTVEALVTHLQLDSRHLYNRRPKTSNVLIGRVWRDPRGSC